MGTKSIAQEVAVSVKPIGDREFALFQKLIYRSAGIHLSAAKTALLEARLTKRIRELGFDSFTAYYEFLLAGGGDAELGELLDRVATNETRFFREPRQFDFLEQAVFPQWQSEAANGEEQSKEKDRCPPARSLFLSPWRCSIAFRQALAGERKSMPPIFPAERCVRRRPLSGPLPKPTRFLPLI